MESSRAVVSQRATVRGSQVVRRKEMLQWQSEGEIGQAEHFRLQAGRRIGRRHTLATRMP